jgi:glyoxylase-like metal-dependent hydrolase (beta-lactamase superfamily II)
LIDIQYLRDDFDEVIRLIEVTGTTFTTIFTTHAHNDHYSGVETS